jgi:hypothetical protein
MFGAVIDSVETGVKYDYQSTNCPEWERFDEMVKHYSELKKQRETFLKSLKEPLNIITDDGEIVTINPPIKSSTTALKITLK